MANHNIYISHAWGGESEEIVQEIYKRCRAEGLNIILDRKDLGYRQSITSFMHELGRADAIILVVSNKYLHSEYCMFELLQIYENKNIIQRIFPVVLDEVSIAKSTERLDLVKYWEKETESLEAKIRELKNLSYIEGITDDLNLYQKIRNNIANLTKILKDINTLNIKLHKDHDYQQLIESIQAYLAKTTVDQSGSETLSTGRGASTSRMEGQRLDIESPERSKEERSKASVEKKTWWRKVFLILPIVLLITALGVWWTSTDDNKTADPPPSETQLMQGVPRPIGMLDAEDNAKSVIPKDTEATSNMTSSNPKTIVTSPRTHINPQTNNKSPKAGSEKAMAEVASENLTSESAFPDPPKQEDLEATLETHRTNAPPELKTLLDDDATDQIEEVAYRIEEVYVPAREVSIQIANDISSNQVKDGEVIYLKLLEPLSVQGRRVVDQNARVRASVIDVKPSRQGGRSSLGIRLEAVETVDGQWLELSYHDIVDRRRGEIVFEAGTVFEQVKINPATINLKVIQ